MGVCSNLCEVSSVEEFLACEQYEAEGGDPESPDAPANPILAEADLDKAEGEIVEALEDLLEPDVQHLLEPEGLELSPEQIEEVFCGDAHGLPEVFSVESVRKIAAALPDEDGFAAQASEYASHYYSAYRQVFQSAAASGHPVLRFFY